MLRQLSNFVPKRLASQLLLLLVLALLVAFVISILVAFNAQKLNDRSMRDQLAVERVYEVATMLEALSVLDRQEFAKAAKTRSTLINVQSQPYVSFTANNNRSRNLANKIMDALDSDEVRASVLSSYKHSGTNDPRESGRNRELLIVSVRLGPDEWLNFSSRDVHKWYTNTEQSFLFFVFGISMLFVTVFAWFFVRKLARPIEAIAAAARKSTSGDRSVRIPVIGPLEFRDAAVAFNSMQEQIERFEFERARTIAAVGHDLRTPLTSLRLRAEMIENQDLKEPMIKTLEEVSLMADGLVTYAQHNMEELFIEQLDLHSIVTKLAKESGIVFDSAVYPKVTGGPVSLTRAIRNLTDNANRYATLISITLEIKGKNAIVCIYDEGPGISEELLDTIREPFVRGEESRSVDTGGYGLGLAISQEIIRSHGGELKLMNYGNNKGLCAQLTLPLLDLSTEG